jgi:arsenate reductase-like glutaredoxin family protein
LLKQGAELEMRDMGTERLTESELDTLIGAQDYRRFLNSRNELYRARKMGENPPARAEAIRLMSREPNLIRRPMAIGGGRVVLGYDEEALRGLAGSGSGGNSRKKKAR